MTAGWDGLAWIHDHDEFSTYLLSQVTQQRAAGVLGEVRPKWSPGQVVRFDSLALDSTPGSGETLAPIPEPMDEFGAVLPSVLYSVASRGEVSTRYRPAVLASMCITAVAALSYLVLIIKFDTGYDRVGGRYVPNPEAALSIALRYMDWSVTVPLLTAELIAVCTLVGAAARRTRFATMAAAFLMIVTGFFGAQLVDVRTDSGWRMIWGLISTVFFLYLYLALIPVLIRSLRELPEGARRPLLHAGVLLGSVFGVYPMVYIIPIYAAPTPGWAVTTQVAFSVADIAAKAGFGALIHKVAKIRTAADVTAGHDTHPEAVYVGGERLSAAVSPHLPAGPEPAVTPLSASAADTLDAGAGPPRRG